jgi:hypothetical protein
MTLLNGRTKDSSLEKETSASGHVFENQRWNVAGHKRSMHRTSQASVMSYVLTALCKCRSRTRDFSLHEFSICIEYSSVLSRPQV